MGAIEALVGALPQRAVRRGLAALSRARRSAFVASTRARAATNHATVDLDIDPSVQFGRGIRAMVFPGTHTALRIERNTVLGDGVFFRLKGGNASIGPGCDLRRDVNISVGGSLVLEGDILVTWGAVLHCDESVEIGAHTIISEYCTVADSAHVHVAPDVNPHRNLRTCPVRIGRGVWLCPKVTVTSGVTIGDHTIVGAGSTVTRDLPGGHLAAGLPAVPLQPLDLPWQAP